MPIDPDSYVPAYQQIADDLRGRIESRELPPGRKLPAEDRLADSYGVGKDTVREALAQLRSEGLIRTVNRDGSYVREQIEPDVVQLQGPARIRTRMPTPEERRRFRLDEGVPVLVVEAAGELRILPGHDTELEIPPPR
ncbi:GntR family transcriptional regulator [Streptosporangium sandarakinum]|uniref:GntR family transcriptional regulator n=1 Tax=Streptosporangium sandarakinum TaxID=1260955 RepID=UPI00379FD220